MNKNYFLKNENETSNTEKKSENQSLVREQEIQSEVSEKVLPPPSKTSQYWKDMNEFLVNLA